MSHDQQTQPIPSMVWYPKAKKEPSPPSSPQQVPTRDYSRSGQDNWWRQSNGNSYGSAFGAPHLGPYHSGLYNGYWDRQPFPDMGFGSWDLNDLHDLNYRYLWDDVWNTASPSRSSPQVQPPHGGGVLGDQVEYAAAAANQRPTPRIKITLPPAEPTLTRLRAGTIARRNYSESKPRAGSPGKAAAAAAPSSDTANSQ